MRGNLWDDPRVARLCDLTDQPEAMVIGGLYWLWSMADQHTEDGFLDGLTLRQVDRKTGIKGFGDALIAAGWLESDGESLRIPHFEEHNGSSAKKRIQTARRVAEHKAGNAADVVLGADGGESVTLETETGNAVSVTTALPREEKRREEKKEPREKSKDSAPTSAEVGADASPTVVEIPLNTGEQFPISEARAKEFAGLYRAVDVPQALRSMRAWAIANPTKRKTKAGIMKFVNGWLAREQNNGGHGGSLPPDGITTRFPGML
jgi:hypothetical protein